MHNNNKLPELYEVVDKEKIHVHDPNLSLFVCGGPQDVTSTETLSYRDALLKTIAQTKFGGAHILVAEELKPHFPNGNYVDLLSFETDIASISKLVILFSESYGSAAELGTFSSIKTIAERLLVFVDDINHKQDSYVKLGPFRSLERQYSDYHICVMPTKLLGTPVINNRANLQEIKLDDFRDMVESAIDRRLPQVNRLAAKSTFDPQKVGHIIRMICGLAQFYGALEITEIQLLLEEFGVSTSESARTEDLALCAEMVGWVKRVRSSRSVFIVPVIGKSATSFPFLRNAGYSRTELEPLIRAHYKEADNERFKLIASAAAELDDNE